MKSSEAFQKIFNETTIRSLGFCDKTEITLAPKESFSTKINQDSILDLPIFFEAFSWEIFNLNHAEQDYIELLISFYSELGKDQEAV